MARGQRVKITVSEGGNQRSLYAGTTRLASARKSDRKLPKGRKYKSSAPVYVTQAVEARREAIRKIIRPAAILSFGTRECVPRERGRLGQPVSVSLEGNVEKIADRTNSRTGAWTKEEMGRDRRRCEMVYEWTKLNRQCSVVLVCVLVLPSYCIQPED